MVLEGAFDDLMQDVGRDELVYVGMWEIGGKWLSCCQGPVGIS